MSRRILSLAGALALAVTTAAPAGAVITTAAGWHAYTIPTPGTVQGGVVRHGNAIFFGQGSFGAGLQQVFRITDSGATLIATGFNSLGGFALGGDGTLYVADNGGNLPGAVTGDSVFAIPDALTRTTALPAVNAEIVPPGSIPAAQDVAFDGKDLIVSDAAGPGAGRVVRVSGGGVTDLITTGLDYTAGVTVAGTRLLVGNVDGSFVGSLAEYTLAGAFVTSLASGLSGEYAQELDNDDNVLVTGGFAGDFTSNVIAIAPGGGITERAKGFGFTTELFHDTGRNETLVLDAGSTAVTAICHDGDANNVCDADEPCVGVTVARARVKISKLFTPLGDDKLSFKGEMTIPTTPAIDPLNNGARVVLTDDDGTVLDVSLPIGPYDRVKKEGWKVNGSGTTFTFYSSRIGVSGIRKVKVTKVAAIPGLVKFRVTGKAGSFAVTPASLPLKATFVLNTAGQCGLADFTGPTPICTFNASLTTVQCK